MKKFHLVFSVITLIVVSSCDYIERPKSYFSDYQELKDSGIIEKGWVANFIPKSAYDIHEQHDIDTNRVKMTFKFDENDTKPLTDSCNVKKTGEETIYFCKYRKSNIRIITNAGKAKYSSESI